MHLEMLLPVVPVWNFKHAELAGLRDVEELDLSDEGESPSLSMVAERYYMNRSVLGDSPPDDEENNPAGKINGVNGEVEKKEENSKNTQRNMCDAGCQTIVTGEVLATQLFHEEF